MRIDIQSDMHRMNEMGLLDRLLEDKTTGKHILWATAAYSKRGPRYSACEEIAKELITGTNSGIIRTRAAKEADQRSNRTRQRGEIFTPLWICKQMCDRMDEMRDSAAGWRRYVDSNVLEITCGEAPFLVSRYDMETGEVVPVTKRIGLLDRKLRVINENVGTCEEWLNWVIRAFQATFGYELQGDSLLIARINMLATFEEYLWARWQRKPSITEYEKLIDVIDWNIWQMDGLHGTIPGTRSRENLGRYSLSELADATSGTHSEEVQPCCRIYDWNGARSIEYAALRPEDKQTLQFDFVIGNPPYQEEMTGIGRKARPLYNLFMEQIRAMGAARISLIIPSRWFAKSWGLGSFRTSMMHEKKLRYLVDFANAKDCFFGTSISGGVCYFLWDEDYCGDCEFTNIDGKTATTMVRALGEFSVLVRYNEAVGIIRKIRARSRDFLMKDVSVVCPFGLPTKERGTSQREDETDLRVFSSAGIGFIPRSRISMGEDYVDCYKLMVSQTSAEHSAKPDKDGRFRVLTSAMRAIGPGDVCTHSYLLVGRFEKEKEAASLLAYMKTKFARCMLLLAMSSIHVSKKSFAFVPNQDFAATSDLDWARPIPQIDQQLYRKYGLTDAEIRFIDSHLKEME